jgi:Fibronectin type III domain
MPKDNPKTKKQTNEALEVARGSDKDSVLATLEQVFSTFREQLQTEVPKPFTGNAKNAVDKFNDIVAGLRFESHRPRAIKIAAKSLSPTGIELTWEDVAGNADGYRVERCQGCNCQDLDEIARLASTNRSFKDFNLSPTTPYRYRVVAFNFRGETSSKIVDITPTTRQQEQ